MEQINLFSEEFERQAEYINNMMIEASKMHNKAHNMLMHLREHCPHIKTSITSEYYDGSYHDTAYTKYIEKCSCCGKIISSTTKDHGWYG